jgi:putative phosphoribosyl transferase
MKEETMGHGAEQTVEIPVCLVTLVGTLMVPAGARGVVLFAHGSGSSRHSPRNRFVARTLGEAGLGTLLLDLLTPAEEEQDRFTAHIRFDIDLLAKRLAESTDWLAQRPDTHDLAVGYFGASTGAAAALVAAADPTRHVRAVVSRGGRPDLAGDALGNVHAPTLLIVGGNDPEVLHLNEQARRQLRGECRLTVIPGATHLFEEPGTLEEVARLARDWFSRHLVPAVPSPVSPRSMHAV